MKARPAHRRGQLGQDIVARLAEDRIILVHAVLLRQPQGARVTVDRQIVRQPGDLVILVDQVALPLEECARDDTETVGRWRRDAKLLARLLEMVGRQDALARVDLLPGIVLEIEIAGDPADRMVQLVIDLRVIGVIRRLGIAPVQIGAGIGHVPIADLALDRQRGLDEAVAAIFGEEMLDLQVADAGIVAEAAMVALFLVQDGRRHRPFVVEIDLQRGAAAIGLDVVIVLLDEGIVVDGDPARLWQEAARSRDIVDEAGIAFVESDDAQRRPIVDRGIDHPLQLAADATRPNAVHLAVDAAVEARMIGLVGDDADRARFGRCTVQRAPAAPRGFRSARRRRYARPACRRSW